MKKKIVVAIAGASGSLYAKLLLQQFQKLNEQIAEVGVVMSENAKDIWQFELDEDSYQSFPFKYYGKNDFTAPFASGSARFMPSAMRCYARTGIGSACLPTRN